LNSLVATESRRDLAVENGEECDTERVC